MCTHTVHTPWKEDAPSMFELGNLFCCPGSWVFVWWFFLRFRSGSGFGTGATWCHMVLHAATELFDVTVISWYSTDVFNWYKYDISMLWLYVCIVWFNITNWSPPRCTDDHWRFEMFRDRSAFLWAPTPLAAVVCPQRWITSWASRWAPSRLRKFIDDPTIGWICYQ